MPKPSSKLDDVPPRRTDVAHAWLDASIYKQLKAEADRFGYHPDRLAAAILTAVIQHGYIDEVLRP